MIGRAQSPKCVRWCSGGPKHLARLRAGKAPRAGSGDSSPASAYVANGSAKLWRPARADKQGEPARHTQLGSALPPHTGSDDMSKLRPSLAIYSGVSQQLRRVDRHMRALGDLVPTLYYHRRALCAAGADGCGGESTAPQRARNGVVPDAYTTCSMGEPKVPVATHEGGTEGNERQPTNRDGSYKNVDPRRAQRSYHLLMGSVHHRRRAVHRRNVTMDVV